MLLRSFLSALTFLTLVPAGGSRMFNQREISVSRGFYPLVGLLIGMLLVALERGAAALFFQSPAAWAVLTAGAPFTPAPLTAAVLLVFPLVITRETLISRWLNIRLPPTARWSRDTAWYWRLWDYLPCWT